MPRGFKIRGSWRESGGLALMMLGALPKRLNLQHSRSSDYGASYRCLHDQGLPLGWWLCAGEFKDTKLRRINSLLFFLHFLRFDVWALRSWLCVCVHVLTRVCISGHGRAQKGSKETMRTGINPGTLWELSKFVNRTEWSDSDRE